MVVIMYEKFWYNSFGRRLEKSEVALKWQSNIFTP